ncbi:Dipeptidyl aminopeptidase/acylaminoacyl peptidase [Austwickia chelonae]|uniref:Putative S9 family peptidase n=1 Tax=Austwickia chelonae NBRC 105200 TaxID=1184607 RepID=K6V985_9MICO|nr:prolyl oligopeptidase family serine peptidase [Austwickia chelonae]GAB78798.1 putative S9 family peptidase [Austwickia chelonae NBRC 105200]SEV84436.1 Dipeptidyl aminopeptidase/acylaminoacyl peptidase [Austwickia chelonae]
MKKVLPHGEWPSPITAETLTRASCAPVPRTDGGDCYVLRTSPDTGSIVHLTRLRGNTTEDISPDGFSVISRVHEYGGGEYAVRDGIVLAVERTTQRLWRLDNHPYPLAPQDKEARVRYAAMEIDPDRQIAWAVREDHRGDGEPVNTLIRLRLDGQNPGHGTVPTLTCRPGHDSSTAPDFVIDPTLSPDGTHLAWVQWTHPHMPWDAAQVWVARIDDDGDLVDARPVAGQENAAATEPVWTDDTHLAVLDERTGWTNPYLIDITTGHDLPLHPVAEEYGLQAWVLREKAMTALPDGRLVAVRWIDGFAQPTLLDPAELTAADLGPRLALADHLSVGDGRVVMRAVHPDRPGEVIALDPDTGRTETLWTYGQDVPDGYAPRPRPVHWAGHDGETAHGFLYLPTHPEVRGPDEEKPPLMVISHGGPTSSAIGGLDVAKAYLTSRGIAVLDVNYGGSTGYGRAYRERLTGRWGVVDVVDCVEGARHLADTAVVDGRRLAIRGGSAGGYCTLSALTFHDVFTAGVSFFGVSDLASLAADTHKFESRYTYRLVGPWPEAEATYVERSPIHHLDGLSCPLLLLQGTEDKVVPPAQARLMADAVRAKGLPVALIEFEGEGHGFREPAHVVRAQEAETSFLAQVWGYTPAEDIEPVMIENLTQAVP